MKLIKWLDEHLEETLLVVLLVFIACVQFAQVIIRRIPSLPSLTWAEEFCRFAWIWSVFLSLPYTVRKGTMLRVSVLPELLSGRSKHITEAAVWFFTLAVMLVLGIYSVGVVSGVAKSAEVSPAMLIPMRTVYAIMPVCFFGTVLRAAQQIAVQLRAIADYRDGEAE